MNNWYCEFGLCPLVDGMYKGRNPFSQMRVNKAFYDVFKKMDDK